VRGSRRPLASTRTALDAPEGESSGSAAAEEVLLLAWWPLESAPGEHGGRGAPEPRPDPRPHPADVDVGREDSLFS